MKSTILVLTLVLTGCLTPTMSPTATPQLQKDILESIQSQYGKSGLPPILHDCAFLGRHQNGSYVERWSVLFSGSWSLHHFIISMKTDHNGETVYLILPAPQNKQ
jgi:hypothetical protein